TWPEPLPRALGDDVQLNSTVNELVHRPHFVAVRYSQAGTDDEVQARTAALATTANISRGSGVALPEDLRDALGQIRDGPHVSTAFLANERSARPWDDVYAIAAPKRSFAIAVNQANIVRGMEAERQPGGSFMTFSPASLGRALL